jgi:hypothetical protein
MTTLSKEAEKLLAVVKKERSAQFKEDAALQQAMLKNNTTRAMVADRNLSRIYNKGIEALGIQKETLDAMHAKDLTTTEQFLKEREKTLKACAGNRTLKRRKLAKLFRSNLGRRRLERKAGNPVTTVCLWEAAAIDFTWYCDPGCIVSQWTRTMAVGDNKWQGQILSGTAAGNVAGYLTFDFVFESDCEGMADVIAVISLNGQYSLIAPGNCLRSERALARLNPWMNVSQFWPGSETVFPFTGGGGWFLNREVQGGCSAASESGMLDTQSERDGRL